MCKVCVVGDLIFTLPVGACTSVSETFKTFFDEGQPGNYVLNHYKLVVINQHMFKFSLGHFLTTKEKKGIMDPLRVWQKESKYSNQYNIIEMSSAEVLCHSVRVVV